MDEQLSHTTDDSNRRIEDLLADPAVRARVADAIREEIEAGATRGFWVRVKPVLVGIASGAVTILAFFVPSVQDQWDRFESRRVVSRYAELGKQFLGEAHFALAEEAFQRALDLSDNKRLDVEELRLKARVGRINEDPDWGADNPEEIEESDFLYLLELQPASAQPRERATTLEAYAAFLAPARRWGEAERALQEALRLAPNDPVAWLRLGNVRKDEDRAAEAESAYRKAIELAPRDGRAHYNLGLMLSESGRVAEAEKLFREAAALMPRDAEARLRLGEQLAARGAVREARDAFEQALRLRPEDDEIRKEIERLRQRESAGRGRRP
jgi:Flp pilus assembly protein TadD